jgi:hypothetical protein
MPVYNLDQVSRSIPHILSLALRQNKLSILGQRRRSVQEGATKKEIILADQSWVQALLEFDPCS